MVLPRGLEVSLKTAVHAHAPYYTVDSSNADPPPITQLQKSKSSRTATSSATDEHLPTKRAREVRDGRFKQI